MVEIGVVKGSGLVMEGERLRVVKGGWVIKGVWADKEGSR